MGIPREKERNWKSGGRRKEMVKAAVPLSFGWFWLAQPHSPASHGGDALLSSPISPLRLGCICPQKAATSKPLSAFPLLQTGGDECALGEPSAWLAVYEQPPRCTFEPIPPAFVCLADKTSQQCLEKSLMRDHCLHNKARLPLQMFNLH